MAVSALVRLLANQSITTSTQTAVQWAQAVHDDKNFWSAGSPTRLTVPPRVNAVVLTAYNAWPDNGTGDRWIVIRQNGATDAASMILPFSPVSDNDRVYAQTPLLRVSPGEYFEVLAWQASGGNLNLLDANTTFFSIEGFTADPPFEAVKLLVGFEGADASTTFTDESSFARTLTAVGNAQLDTAQFKFGSASGLFDGNGDYVTAADSADWLLGTTPFTIEGFIRFNDLNAAELGGALVAHYNSSGNQRSWGLYFDSSSGNKLTFIRSSNGTATSVTSGDWPGGAPALNTWYHIAAERDGANILRIYVDGRVIAQESLTTFSFHNSTDTLSIGRLNTTAGFRRWLNGWIDELRIVKGYAVYGGTFIVPASAYPRS